VANFIASIWLRRKWTEISSQMRQFKTMGNCRNSNLITVPFSDRLLDKRTLSRTTKMNSIHKALKTTVWALAFAYSATTLTAADTVTLDIKKSIKITWPSEKGKSYRLMSTMDVGLQNFQSLGQPMDGNGGNITVFYDTQVDQKVFFRVDEGTAPAGQATATATLVNGFITAVTIVENGFGYTEVPTVTFTDSTGSGAMAVAALSDGSVTGITVVNAGSGYSANPTVTIGSPPPLDTTANRVDELETFVKKMALSNTQSLTVPLSLSDVDLSGANLQQSRFGLWGFTNINFSGAFLVECFFMGNGGGACSFSKCDFSNANLRGVSFDDCTLIDCKFVNASFVGGANLRGRRRAWNSFVSRAIE
jgi:uncharacterized protein YjbI with pentapeptide repeats